MGSFTLKSWVHKQAQTSFLATIYTLLNFVEAGESKKACQTHPTGSLNRVQTPSQMIRLEDFIQ